MEKKIKKGVGNNIFDGTLYTRVFGVSIKSHTFYIVAFYYCGFFYKWLFSMIVNFNLSLPAPQLDSDDVDLEDVLNTSNFKDRDVLDTSDIKGTSDLNDTSELNSSADNGDKSEVKDNSGSLFFIGQFRA